MKKKAVLVSVFLLGLVVAVPASALSTAAIVEDNQPICSDATLIQRIIGWFTTDAGCTFEPGG